MFDFKDVTEWLKVAGLTPSRQLVKSLIEEELDEWVNAESDVEKLDAIGDLLVVVANAIVADGFTVDQVQDYVDAISKSNWSKFCQSEQEARDTCVAYQSGTHWDKMNVPIECYADQVGSIWVVKRKSDDKLLKSINYKPVGQILNETE